MKKLEAFIRPHRADDVREALLEAGFRGMTLSEVKGVGRQKGHIEVYRGSEYRVEFLPKVKLELVVTDGRVEAAVTVLIKSAKTGNVGDGSVDWERLILPEGL